MNERRKAPRHAVKVLVFVRAGDDVVQKWVEMQACDVSQGGLCFETSRDLPLESEACIMLGRLGGDIPDSAQIEARVAHSALDETTQRYRVGLAFGRLIDVTREQLSVRIDAWVAGLEG